MPASRVDPKNTSHRVSLFSTSPLRHAAGSYTGRLFARKANVRSTLSCTRKAEVSAMQAGSVGNRFRQFVKKGRRLLNHRPYSTAYRH